MSPASRPSCGNPRCDRSRRRDHLMCPGCWSRVPEPIQRTILAEVRPGSIRQTQAWTDAVDAAIDALNPTKADP